MKISLETAIFLLFSIDKMMSKYYNSVTMCIEMGQSVPKMKVFDERRCRYVLWSVCTFA